MGTRVCTADFIQQEEFHFKHHAKKTAAHVDVGTLHLLTELVTVFGSSGEELVMMIRRAQEGLSMSV